MDNFEVEFYETEDGTEPVKEFLKTLDDKLMAKMVKTIELLAVNGTDLREPYSKPLRNGIFEVRAKVGTDAARVLYFFVIGKKIILTNGFVKKTQKTPAKEIETAEKYRADYMSRH